MLKRLIILTAFTLGFAAIGRAQYNFEIKTEDWVTYTNHGDGIAFRYPSDWFAPYDTVNYVAEVYANKMDAGLKVQRIIRKEGYTLERQLIAFLAKMQAVAHWVKIGDREETTVGGQKAYTFTYSYQIYPQDEKTTSTVYYVEFGKIIYYVSAYRGYSDDPDGYAEAVLKKVVETMELDVPEVQDLGTDDGSTEE